MAIERKFCIELVWEVFRLKWGKRSVCSTPQARRGIVQDCLTRTFFENVVLRVFSSPKSFQIKVPL